MGQESYIVYTALCKRHTILVTDDRPKVNFPNKQLIGWRTKCPRCTSLVQFYMKNLPSNTEGEKHQLTMFPRTPKGSSSEDPNLSYSRVTDGKLNKKKLMEAYTQGSSALLLGTKRQVE